MDKNKEWIISNGIGGYSAGTELGYNESKYHGYLMASLKSLQQRHLILAKVDESVEIKEEKKELYSNYGENYNIQGFKYIKKFENIYYPKYIYEIDETIKWKRIKEGLHENGEKC